MKNKTCGECKHCTNKKIIATCKHIGIVTSDIPACSKFEPQVITNGDRIRQGSDKELVIYKHQWDCFVCIFHDEENKKCHCHRPKDKTCMDGMLAWLNAPANCVKQNGNHDTQADLCKADNTESEGKDVQHS